MEVRKLRIGQENWGRISDLMAVYEAEIDALEDADLSLVEAQVSERINKLVIPSMQPKNQALKFSMGFKRAWKYSATAFLAAAAAVLFIQVNPTQEDRALMLTKGLDGVAGIGCDINLVQMDQDDQDLTAGSFNIVAGQASFLKLRCEPGTYAHVAVTPATGLKFLLKNQVLPSKTDFLRQDGSLFNLTQLAQNYEHIVVIVTKEQIKADDLQWQRDQLSWKTEPRPLWSELIFLKLR